MRLDCPECGRNNSVAVYKETGKTVYKCFGANCGKIDTIKTELEQADADLIYTPKRKRQFDIKKLIDARANPDALNYIQKNNCFEANTKLYYNIEDKRVVFNYKDLYVGRALDSNVLPKWYNYTNTDTPFKVLHGKEEGHEVILVEDCASACNASSVLDAVALLGTTLKTDHIEELMNYDRIYIALDEDATNKSLRIYDTLSLIKECKIIPLIKDIKYLNRFEIECLLEK